MTVSAPQRVAQTILSTSSATEDANGRVTDIGIDFDQEIPTDCHRLRFRVIDVVGNDRAAFSDFAANELRRYEFREYSRRTFRRRHSRNLAAEVLAMATYSISGVMMPRRA